MSLEFHIRESVMEDAEALSELINDIIRVGGTTANEVPYSTQDFADTYLSGDKYLTCVTAHDSAGTLLGFQSLSKNASLADNWGDIGTFTKLGLTTRGIGTELFKKTRGLATTLSLEALNATIRADNVSGLAYYNKMGFVDYDKQIAIPLKDGTKVDRIKKRFLLKWY